MQDNELLTERQVRNCYGLSVPWQRRTRRERRGPPFLKLGRMVRYRRADIEAYLAASTIEPKSISKTKSDTAIGTRTP